MRLLHVLAFIFLLLASPAVAAPQCPVETSEDRITEAISDGDVYFKIEGKDLDLFIANVNDLYNIGWQRNHILKIWVFEAEHKSENPGFQAVHLFFIGTDGCIAFYQTTYMSLVKLLLTPDPLSILQKASFDGWFGSPDAINAVVKVEYPGGHGSGVLIGPNTVLTAKHVTAGQNKDAIRVMAVGGHVSHSVSIWELKDSDISVVKLGAPIRLDSYPRVSCDLDQESGDRLSAYGYPIHLPLVNVSLTFLTYDFDSDENNYVILADGSVIGGMSGGPVFSERGEVVGLVQGEWTEDSGMWVFDSDINIISSLPHSEVCSI